MRTFKERLKRRTSRTQAFTRPLKVPPKLGNRFLAGLEEMQSVMDGLRQAREGKTKDFNVVCDRVEKKYTNAKV